jgi:hypothetical protein
LGFRCRGERLEPNAGLVQVKIQEKQSATQLLPYFCADFAIRLERIQCALHSECSNFEVQGQATNAGFKPAEVPLGKHRSALFHCLFRVAPAQSWLDDPAFSAAGPKHSVMETSVIARNAILHEQISNMTDHMGSGVQMSPPDQCRGGNLADAESKMVASRHAQRFKGCRVHWCFSGLHCGSSSPSKDR